MATETLKECRKCKAAKPSEAFHRNCRTKDGRSAYCQPCASAMKREQYARWTPQQREEHRDRVLRMRYGVGLEFVQALYEKQEGCCAICAQPGKRPAVEYKRGSQAGVLNIDHNHETGEVRGLLCTNCNVGLGRFGDDPEMFIRAANYVIRDGVV